MRLLLGALSRGGPEGRLLELPPCQGVFSHSAEHLPWLHPAGQHQGAILTPALSSKLPDQLCPRPQEGGIGGVLSQPRLLIPMILALVFNRWNVLYADKVE